MSNFAGSFPGQLGGLGLPDVVNPGAGNDDAEAYLRKVLNPGLKGQAWDALVAAIATGEQVNWDNARLAFDQVFKSTASGLYLTRKAGDDGTQRPESIGMPDDLFRLYSIKSTTSKLVENALLEILDVFYGDDTVRAHADSVAVEPYALSDGDDLTVILDGRTTITTVFTAADFNLVGVARAAEVAAALTRSFRQNGSKAYAIAVEDPTNNTTLVRVLSASLGLVSGVQIVGGKAQTVLNFPELVACFIGLPVWDITFTPATNTLRFAPDATHFDASVVRVGDYVTVYGSEFDPANRGTYPITNVYWAFTPGLTQYFEVKTELGVNQAALTQLAAGGLMVFRSVRQTIHTSTARSVVVSSLNNEIDIEIPATSQAVGRAEFSAAYCQVAPSVTITNVARASHTITFTTGSAHGLAAGDQIVVDGAWGVGPGVNCVFTVTTIVDPTHFTATSDFASSDSGAVTASFTPFKAPSSVIAGPFSYDPLHGVALTSKSSASTVQLNAGLQYASVNVMDATQFPDAPGWLVFAFGYEYQEGPVKYLGRLSATSLAIDYAHRFKNTIPSGADVALLIQKGPWVPVDPEQVGSFYVTASPAGRVAATDAIDNAVAGGIPLSLSVAYPGDRGLGGEGLPSHGAYKLSDKVAVWGSDEVDAEIAAAKATE